MGQHKKSPESWLEIIQKIVEILANLATIILVLYTVFQG